MKLIIDIPEEEYKLVRHGNKSYTTELELMNAVANGTPLPESYGDLIDRTKLYDQTAEWEAQALEQVNRYNPEDSIDEWRWWSAVLKERGAFKHDVADAPTIIEGSDSD